MIQSTDQPTEGETNQTLDNGTSKQVTTTFDDDVIVPVINQPVLQKYYKPTASAEADIAKFMSRPVRVSTVNWAIGGSIDTSTAIWKAYFQTTAIKSKLDNYALLRCDLHLKFVINASPFYYGALLISYNPLDITLNSARYDSAADVIVPFSQRPHAWLYPQTNEGAEMVIPYMNTKEWLQVNTTDAIDDFGRLHFDSVTDLQTANGTVGTSIDVTTYAWAENVQLAGLTVDVSLQSKDEYTKMKGPISKPASAISRATSLLSNVPVIGPYMTATSIAADGVANIAALFGYSKVPTIDNVQAFKNLPFHGLATSDISEPTEKLSIDSKNELTINNTCIGDEKVDPLNISTFCQHNSYLTQFAWAATDTAGTLLWNTYINPLMASKTAGTSQTLLNPTPMWVAANCFSYWRGDIIFEFKVICSQYHRGRLVVAWDPVGDVANTTDTSQLCYTQVIDITESTNFTVRVPYTQAAAYLKVPSSLTADIYDTSALTADTSDTVNGILTVRVRNEQTSPVASAPIQILVSVRGAENLEFAAPKAIEDDIYFYTVQSKDIVTGTTQVDLGGDSSVDPHINLVYMGEKVESLRSLLMRCNHSVTYEIESDAINIKQYKNTMNRRPLYKGFDTDGIHTATGHLVVEDKAYNFVTTTPYHLISQCFLGERGSFTWKLNVANDDPTTINVTRKEEALSASNYPFSSSDLTSASNSQIGNFYRNEFLTPGGAAMVNQRTNTGVSCNLPMYSRLTMLDTSPATRTEGKANISGNDAFQTSLSQRPTTSTSHSYVSFWFQVGPDYSPYFFLNVPTVYVYDAAVVPV